MMWETQTIEGIQSCLGSHPVYFYFDVWGMISIGCWLGYGLNDDWERRNLWAELKVVVDAWACSLVPD